jgi:hypothetical protein
MDVLKQNGYLVGLYSMASWLEQSWVTSSGIRNTYEGWVAHLTVNDDVYNTGISSPYYDDLLGKYGTRYGMHQYSFSTYVNGAGPFDANVAFKDYPAIVKKYGFNGYGGVTETWIEKACFDPMVYRDRNKDLANLTDAQLKEHWLNHGIAEGRASSTILDLGFYVNNNPDVKNAFTKNGVTDFTAVYNHFITKGYKEYRKSSALFDGKYYIDRYSDVASSFKEEYLRHYVENGMAEGRRASLTFDPNYYWFIRSDVYDAWPDNYSMCAKHYAGHGIVEQIEAYDHVHPTISNATISNISADGYTVTCTVTDDWGINKVVFPTWTLLNDQDDLAYDFMNTQKGTKDGNTYTFTVKASDHNNEGGKYITHIYAIDKGGNQTKIILDVVTVEDIIDDSTGGSVPDEPLEPEDPFEPVTPSLDKITLKSSSSYTREEMLLEKVQENTTVQELLSQFENEVLEVLDKNGKKISGSSLVGTCSMINLYNNGVLVDSVTVVILGDVDGNGIVDTTDVVRVKAAFLGSFLLDDAESIAADVDCNGIIDTTDYMRVKSHFIGAYNLYN